MSKPIRALPLGAIALGLGVTAVAACNSVLGIESAKLEQAAESLECELPEQRPVNRCEQSNACETCISSSCGSGVKQCVDDEECRSALTNHRICVRDGCQDESLRCAECLGRTEGAECLADCAEDCQGNELVSLCTLYCACMESKCPQHAPEDCLTSCSETDDWELECMLSHCELAPLDPDHCLHATHEIRRCPMEAPDTVPGCDASKALRGYGCGSTADCCEGVCIHGGCE